MLCFIPSALLLVCVLGTSVASASPSSSDAALVHTRTQGSFAGNHLSNGVDEFLGIPFAQAPVKALRFAKPQRLPRVDDAYAIRNATQWGATCMQVPSDFGPPYPHQSEDCLVLNVYSPSAHSNKHHSMPVMVWIYGGGYQDGSINDASLNASAFVQRSMALKEPVVWVAANYRVGTFGFMAGHAVLDVERAGKGQVVRNPGLWDQRAALLWVQDNIAAFGGDPKRVIVYGQSAGAAGVGHQLMADKGRGSKGLFRGAILQSGSAATGRRLAPVHPEVEATYASVLRGAGCSNKTASDVQVTCLQSKSTADIMAGSNAATATAFVPFQPVLDDYFVQQLPSAQWHSGEYLRVPIITGNTLDEGTVFIFQQNITVDDAFMQSQGIVVGEQIQPIGKQILQTWSSDPTHGSPHRPEFFGVSTNDTYYPPNGTNQYKRQASMAQDVIFEAGRHMQLHVAAQNGVSAWSYRFAQPSPVIVDFTGAKDVSDASVGVSHGSDIAYAYAMPPLAGHVDVPEPLRTYASDANVQQVSDVMSAAWIHFAHRLDPNGHDVTTKWTPYNHKIDGHGNGQQLYLQGGNISMRVDDLEAEQVRFVIANKQYFVI